jgi:RNA polymerase sigma-70 factor, ECF subfamily
VCLVNPTKDDRKLVAEIEQHVPAARTGDPDALVRLMKLVEPFVLRWCQARVGSSPGQVSAEDVAQEVCRAIEDGIEHDRPDGPFLAWVAGITSNKAAEAYRRHQRERPTPNGEGPDADDTAEGRAVAMMRGEPTKELRLLLDHLPETMQAVLIMRIAQGLSVEETGRVLDMSEGNVRVAQHRALERLRELVAS